MPGGLIPVAVPAPAVQYDQDIFWPSLDGFLSGAAFATAGSARYGGLNTNTAFWSAATGAGTSNMDAQAATLLLCGQFASSGAGAVVHRSGLLSAHMPLLKGGVPVPFKYPTQYRLWRFQMLWTLQAPFVPSATGLTFVGVQNNGGAGPANAGNGYFGFAADPDGTWHWVSRIGAAGFGFSEDVPTLLPLDATWRLMDLVVLAATNATDAQLQVFLNGNYSAPYLTRPWGVGSKLPLYTTAAVAGTGLVVFAGADDPAAAAVLQVGPCRISGGHYTPNGAEI